MNAIETVKVFEIIERMAALIRSEERKKCTELGLQLVHFQVLDYLARCNRYSDTPAALSNYLGMTRGTVSQTLLLLAKKGYVQKTIDHADRRVVHLSLLPEGRVMLEKARPSELFLQATSIFQQHSFTDAETVFVTALKALQKANQSQSFGLCLSCRHFTKLNTSFQCGLTKELLSQEDSEKICQEHTI